MFISLCFVWLNYKNSTIIVIIVINIIINIIVNIIIIIIVTFISELAVALSSFSLLSHVFAFAIPFFCGVHALAVSAFPHVYAVFVSVF